ncbi:MAG TPA: T9SS type A sorting domain-containing protein, partial [Paludibacter sp.]
EGAVSINNYSIFCGTIVCNNGALGAINTGVTLNGRALTTSGALTTAAINTIMPNTCPTTGIPSIAAQNTSDALTIAPNPFSKSTNVVVNDPSKIRNYRLMIYNVLGKEVMNASIMEKSTTLNTSSLHSGIYFYKVLDNNNTIQTGKMISK